MMNDNTIYTTSDGRNFHDLNDALAHSSELLDATLSEKAAAAGGASEPRKIKCGKAIITLPSPELEKLLRGEIQVSPETIEALIRKGIESELAERSLGMTLAEVKEDNDWLRGEVNELRNRAPEPRYCDNCSDLEEEIEDLEREINRLEAKLEEREQNP